MTVLQEYDLEINPAKIMKGQGLFLLVSQSNDLEQEQQWEQEEDISVDIVKVISTPTSKRYDDIRFYHTHGYAPITLYLRRHRDLRLKNAPYHLIDGVPFRRNYDCVFLICLEKVEADNILLDFHANPTRGHYLGEIISHKILRAGYYWAMLFKYAYSFV